MKEVWPDTFVEDANLSVDIANLRKALDEHRTSQPERAGHCFESVAGGRAHEIDARSGLRPSHSSFYIDLLLWSLCLKPHGRSLTFHCWLGMPT